MAPETTSEIDVMRRKSRSAACLNRHRQEPEGEDRDGNEEPARVVPHADAERGAAVEGEGERYKAPQQVDVGPVRERLECPPLGDQIRDEQRRKQASEDGQLQTHEVGLIQFDGVMLGSERLGGYARVGAPVYAASGVLVPEPAAPATSAVRRHSPRGPFPSRSGR